MSARGRRHDQRRSIRLPGYDYSAPGTYFRTLCTHDRACLFGEVAALRRIRIYIRNNPARWVADTHHPARITDRRDRH
jgi:hypothetical protein